MLAPERRSNYLLLIIWVGLEGLDYQELYCSSFEHLNPFKNLLVKSKGTITVLKGSIYHTGAVRGDNLFRTGLLQEESHSASSVRRLVFSSHC